MASTTATRALLALPVALAFALPMPAQSQTEQPASTTETPAPEVNAETVVARVGDVEITMGEVVLMRQALPPQYSQLPDEVLFTGIVDQLIDQELLAREAPTGDATPKRLQLEMTTERRALLARHTIDEVRGAEVSDADIQAAYDEVVAGIPVETEYNASHILVASEDEAKALVEELNGGADFATLAAEKSTGPSGPNGGQLGWFGKGAMVPEFEAVVLALEVGTISEPVQTQFGWHVVRLNETREKPAPTLEQLRQDLVSQILQTRLEAKVAELRAAAEVVNLSAEIPAAAMRDDAILPLE